MEEKGVDIIRNNEKVKGAIKDILSEFKTSIDEKDAQLQKYSELIKNELKSQRESFKQTHKRAVEKVIKGYEEILRLKDDKLLEYTSLLTELKNRYATLLSNQKVEVEKDLEEKAKETGLPPSVLNKSKQELATDLVKIGKENFEMQKNLDFLKDSVQRLQIETKTSKKSSETKFNKLLMELKHYFDKNNELETNLYVFEKKVEVLNKQIQKTKELYEQRVNEVKQKYETVVQIAKTEKTEDLVHVETENEILKDENANLKQELYEKEIREKEFSNRLEKKMKTILTPLLNEFFSDDLPLINEHAAISIPKENLHELITTALDKGDSQDKIVQEITIQGFENNIVISTIEKIRKEKK